ncbi:MAG: hypothetical protein Q4F60_02180, partial [Candidatus Saccharibacteria bacterium]|nr:hypothetical protein [Candidatus Saccharibacteria bacterium]
MAKQDKEKIEEIFRKAGAYSAVFFMAFFVALVSASAFTPVDKSEAATTEVNISGAGYYFQLTSADTARMALNPTAEGAPAVAKDTITIKTNSPGYKVYVSMNGNDTNLYLDGDSSKASIGTMTSTAALATNKWGWALADSSASASNVIQNYGFDTIYCLSSGACSDGNPGSLNTNNKFAGMPTASSPALIAYSASKPCTATLAECTGETQDIYYGVKATTALVSGDYSGTVVYTAVGEATEAMNGTISFDNDSQQVLTGQSRTIATSLYASQALVDAIPTSDVSVTIDGKACTNPSLSVVSGAVNVTCTTPTMTKWGTYDVAVAIGSYGTFGAARGYSYYIPYNTIKSAQDGRYTMQEFTSKTCDEMPTPAAYSGDG